MGTFHIDGAGRPGILCMTLSGVFTRDEMERYVQAHNAAIDALDGVDYRVFVDIRELAPLSPECTALMEEAKAYSSSRPNFRGSAVLVASKIIALQHQRTSIAGGVMSTELISEDRAACEAHLSTIHRRR
jgi:hypothetical protein